MEQAPDRSPREVEDRFIECWGEISALWGVNPSIGRIHALLFLSPAPLDLEAIRERLAISHGNASTSLRELLGWGVVRRLRPVGERRATFESEKDPWTWFHRTIEERRRREISPLLVRLEEVRDHAREERKGRRGAERAAVDHVVERIETFTAFTEEFVDLVDAFLAVGSGRMGKSLRSLAKLAAPRRRAP